MKVRVLVVEDEEAIAEPLADRLHREGLDAKVVPSVALARDSIEADPPDVILLDLMLPDGDGRGDRDVCGLLSRAACVVTPTRRQGADP